MIHRLIGAFLVFAGAAFLAAMVLCMLFGRMEVSWSNPSQPATHHVWVGPFYASK